jgi:hypothetical protein
MGYNRFRWWSKGKKHRKLPKNAPLLSKIKNGDFEVSSYYEEAKQAQRDADRIYNEVYEKMSKFSNDTNAIELDARDASRMRRIAREKLLEAALEEEQRLLGHLKLELEEEFGKDLWEKSMEKQRGKGTTEDIYWWYKKQVGGSYTKSELKMRGINVKN